MWGWGSRWAGGETEGGRSCPASPALTLLGNRWASIRGGNDARWDVNMSSGLLPPPGLVAGGLAPCQWVHGRLRRG